MTAPIRSMPEGTELVDDKYEVFRVVTDMEALHEAFRDRVEDLQVTRIAVDVAGRLTPGYSSKLLCEPPMKLLGLTSLPRMLKATGMALVLVIDDERFAPLKAKMAKRKRIVPPNGSIKKPAWLITREASQNMQVLRNKKLSPRQRRLIAKRAAKARWNRPRKSPAPAAAQPGA